MFGLGWGEILLILVVVLILFGAGKLPKVMGELGKGISSFKASLKGEDKPAEDAPMESETDQDERNNKEE